MVKMVKKKNFFPKMVNFVLYALLSVVNCFKNKVNRSKKTGKKATAHDHGHAPDPGCVPVGLGCGGDTGSQSSRDWGDEGWRGEMGEE